MANIHPFFSGIDVNGAANWTLQFLTNNVVSTTTNLSPKPNIIISEGNSVPPDGTNGSWMAHGKWIPKLVSRGNRRVAVFHQHVPCCSNGCRSRLLLVRRE